MNYTYLVPIIVVILLGISLPESFANKTLCNVFTVSGSENYTCNSMGSTITFIPENIMTTDSNYIKNENLFNSILGGGGIGQFDYIVFGNRTGYFAINGNNGESSTNSNFAALMNSIMSSHSSIFVKSGIYPLASTINLKPDMRIILDAYTIIQAPDKRISLGADTIIQVPDTNIRLGADTIIQEPTPNINLDADTIILPQDDNNNKLDSQQFIGTEVDISDEDFDLVEAYGKTAEASFDAEDYDEAISYYDKILKIVPTDIDSLNGKAHALENTGKHEEAITYYDKALEIIPSDIDALNGKANALESIGNLDEAIANLEKIVEQNTPSVEEEPLVTAEPANNVSSSEKINDFEQNIFVIVIVFLVILNSIIVLDWIVKKQRNVEKKSQAKVQ